MKRLSNHEKEILKGGKLSKVNKCTLRTNKLGDRDSVITIYSCMRATEILAILVCCSRIRCQSGLIQIRDQLSHEVISAILFTSS